MDSEANITDSPKNLEHEPLKTDNRRRGVPAGCDELMTIQQVMDTSKFSRSFVDAAIRGGELVTIKQVRTHRIRVSEYNAWVDWLDRPKNKAA
jgi:hypothetical protein